MKTRRVETYIKLNKAFYNYLLILSLINRFGKSQPYFNSYSVYNVKELSKNVWSFYSNLIPSNMGLINSNYHKSMLVKLTRVTKTLVDKPCNSYLLSFEAYHFSTKKDIFKKLVLLYANALPCNSYTYNSRFDVYNNYTWLNWYLRLNPLNNLFYLKIYNY